MTEYTVIFITVKRGNGKACGTYYAFKDNSTPTYEEVYYFKKNKYGEIILQLAIFKVHKHSYIAAIPAAIIFFV